MRVCSHSRLSLIRRAIAAYVAVSIGFFSCVQPARAFAPVAVIGAAQVVAPGAASYALAALAGLIGLTGLYLELSDDQGNKARMPLSDRPDAEPAAPSAPSNSSGSVQTRYIGGGQTHDSYSAACSAAFSFQQMSDPPPTNYEYVLTVNNGSQCAYASRYIPSGWTSGDYPLTVGTTTGLVCPSGYVESGGSCVLANPREATPDKNCDLKFNARKYMYYDDADCPSGPSIDHSKAVPGLRANGEIAYVYGKDSFGRPVLLEVLRQGDGTQTVVRQYVQSGANVQTTTATVNATTGAIESVSTSTNPGQITAPATAPSDPATAANPTTTPTATTDTTKNPEIVFPDDYAREPTLQATKTAIDQIHTDLTEKESMDDPTIPGSSEFTDSFFSGTFDALKGWQLPGHSSQCPVGSFDWNGTTYSINAHCQLVADHFNALQAAMTVVWSLLALFIVLRA